MTMIKSVSGNPDPFASIRRKGDEYGLKNSTYNRIRMV
jgi:hypothetical protein